MFANADHTLVLTRPKDAPWDFPRYAPGYFNLMASWIHRRFASADTNLAQETELLKGGHAVVQADLLRDLAVQRVARFLFAAPPARCVFLDFIMDSRSTLATIPASQWISTTALTRSAAIGTNCRGCMRRRSRMLSCFRT